VHAVLDRCRDKGGPGVVVLHAYLLEDAGALAVLEDVVTRLRTDPGLRPVHARDAAR
jgi:hypothetical protein